MAQLLSNIDIDVNIDIIRKRSTSSSKLNSRETSTHSITSSVPYYEKMEAQNNFLNKEV